MKFFKLSKRNIPLRFTLLLLLILTGTNGIGFAAQEMQQAEGQFIFTSDPHYGTTRETFQGASRVDAHVVNAAMIGKINALAKT